MKLLNFDMIFLKNILHRKSFETYQLLCILFQVYKEEK